MRHLWLTEGQVEEAVTSQSNAISKLDRLSRDAAWLMGLERQGYNFVIASSPNGQSLGHWRAGVGSGAGAARHLDPH
jgi:hypothetical protein